jgi:hypothetical protein
VSTTLFTVLATKRTGALAARATLPATFCSGVATSAAGPPMASSASTTVSHSTVASWAVMSFSASWRTAGSSAWSASTLT